MHNLKHLSDSELTEKLTLLAGNLRRVESELLVYLHEMQVRRLYALKGYSSLFTYCVRELKFSEGTTCRRLAAARVMARLPGTRSYLEAGSLHSTALAMLENILTADNWKDVCTKASHCSKTQLAWLIASYAPKPDVTASIRKLPAAKSDGGVTEPAVMKFPVGAACPEAPGPRPDKPRTVSIVQPLAPERVMIKCSADAQVAAKIQRAKELLAHKYPGGELEHILEAALDALLDDIAPERKIARKAQRAAKAGKGDTVAKVHVKSAVEKKEPVIETEKAEAGPATPTRRRAIPARVKDAAFISAGGCCTYISKDGHRCEERRFLEFDHVQPFALGGASDEANIRLYCRAHNAFAAGQTFGPAQLWRRQKSEETARV